MCGASQLCNDDPDTLPGTAPQHKQLIQATYRALTAAGRGKKAHNREHARKLAAKRSEVLDFLQVRRLDHPPLARRERHERV